MLPCEMCESQMLDQLYGLLDPEAEIAFRAHLNACPACQASWSKSEALASMLAKAAKSDFPKVTFSAPTADRIVTTPLPTGTLASKPVIQPISASAPMDDPQEAKRPTMRGVASRWLTITLCLFLLAAIGIPLGLEWSTYSKLTANSQATQSKIAAVQAERAQLIADRDSKRQQAIDQARSLQEATERLQKQWQESLVKARKAVENQEFTVSITGPERIQPGAPNEYRIHTLNRQQNHAPAKIEVTVMDNNNQVVYRQPAQSTGDQPLKLSLPIAIWNDVPQGSDLFLNVNAIDGQNGKSALCEKLRLASPVYATQLITDKPMYKPSEIVYIRSLTLDRATFLPPQEDIAVQFKITGPSGAEIFTEQGIARLTHETAGQTRPLIGPDGAPVRGIASTKFALPEEIAGGEYTLTVSRLATPTNPASGLLDTRKFMVNKYVQDQLLKKLEFDAKTYGAGDLVQVKADVARATGEPLVNSPVTIAINIGGEPLELKGPASTDDKGTVRFKFTMPKPLNTEDGSVAITFNDGASVETITRPIPIVSKSLEVTFYPEGGELVAGVPNRVYFQVRTSRGKPADLQGTITDGMKTIASVRTLTDADHPGVNQGLGMFELTPKAGDVYTLKIERPIGIEGKFTLPAAKLKGVVLTVKEGVTRGADPIVVQVQSPDSARTLVVGAYARGRLIDHQRTTVKPGTPTDVTFKPDATASGVVRITVFEETAPGDDAKGTLPVLAPIAERLVFRHPTQVVNLNVQPNQMRYNPSGKVELNISATNEAGKEVPAVVMVAVVQRSVLAMADDKTERALPAHLLLASEVREPDQLEHADFIVGEHPLASMTLDLLLGTQGWRRFVEVTQPNPVPGDPKQARIDRLLASIGQKSQAPVAVFEREAAKLEAEFRPQIDVTTANLQDAQDQQQAIVADQSSDEKIAALEAEAATLTQRLQQSRAAANGAWDEMIGTIAKLAGIACVGLLALGIGLMLASVIRESSSRTLRIGLAGGLCIALSFGVGGTLLVSQMGSPPTNTFANVGTKLQPSAPAVAMMAPADGRNGAVEADFDAKGMAGGGLPGIPQGVGGFGGGGRGVMGPGGMMPPPAAAGDRAEQLMMARPAAPAPGMIPRPLAMKPAAKDDAKGADKFKDQLMERGNELGDAKKELGVARRFKANQPLKEELAKQQQERQLQQQNRKALGDMDRQMKPAGEPMAAMGMLADDAPAGGMPAAGGPMGRAFGRAGARPMGKRDALANIMDLASAPPQFMPFVVREYAHIAPEMIDGLRSDFTETVCWQPAVVLDSHGQAKVSFQLASDIGKYRVLVAAHTLDGRIGANISEIEARKPFSVDPKLPLEVTANDRIDVPVRIVNDSDEPRQLKMSFYPQGLKIDTAAGTSSTLKLDQQVWLDQVRLDPNQRTRRIYRFAPNLPTGEGSALLRLTGESTDPPGAPDSIERKLKVVGEGFPVSGSVSDLLEKTVEVELDLPSTWIPGSLKVDAAIFPVPLGEMQKGLEGMLQEPGGCFEQTSNSNYPNVMILDYLKTTDQASPDTSKRAREMLDRGYGRLTSFECMKPSNDGRQGYEWFGGMAPAHEALTAFGLMQFMDMKRIMPIDEAMLKRTQDYLLGQRDGKGGFIRNARALDAFGGAPPLITDAYIVWALSESNIGAEPKLDLDKEIAVLKKAAETSKDGYFLAILGNILVNRGETKEAEAILTRLVTSQHADGYLDGTTTSITQSSGRYLQIETTSLGMLAWLKANNEKLFGKAIQNAAKWIGKQRDGGGTFGATQSTVLALKALVRHANASRRPAESGTLTVELDGKIIATRPFTKDDRDTVAVLINDAEKLLKPGKNVLKLNLSTKTAYPFTLSWSARTLKPASVANLPVKLSATLLKTDLTEGEAVRMDVFMQNTTKKAHGMVTAIIGLPAGLKVPEDMKQLKRLTELPKDGSAPRLSYFEIRGRELILYWRAMKSEQLIEIPIDLIADVPGEYRGPASRGYVYYDADSKHWVDPLSVRIKAATEEKVGVATK